MDCSTEILQTTIVRTIEQNHDFVCVSLFLAFYTDKINFANIQILKQL